MASTQTVPALSVSQPPISLRWVEKYFYFWMSLLIAAVVVYGFTGTVGHKLVHGLSATADAALGACLPFLKLGCFLHIAVGAGTNPESEAPPNSRLGGSGSAVRRWS
jgi:hypothetical protein